MSSIPKMCRIIYERGKGWYWYIVPPPYVNAYAVHGPYATYEEAKAAVHG